MSLLKSTRGYYIAWGKRIAVELAQRNGTVTSFEVLREMEARGVLPDPDPIPRVWIGAVFNKNKNFAWSGDMVSHTDPKRNNHEQMVRIWVLSDSFTPAVPSVPQLSTFGLRSSPDGALVLDTPEDSPREEFDED